MYEQILRLDFTSSFLRSHPGSIAACEEIVRLLPGRPRSSLPDQLRLRGSRYRAEDCSAILENSQARHRAQSLFRAKKPIMAPILPALLCREFSSNRRDFGLPILPVVHMRHILASSNRNRFTPGQGILMASSSPDDLLRLIALHGAENIAACIVEPASPARPAPLCPPSGTSKGSGRFCNDYNVLLIFDEVICGFGRTGNAFASQSFGVKPDLLVMAKAVTNGVIPMGGVAVSSEICNAILEAEPKRSIEFFHGYTSSAHPVACAACLATLKIYRDDSLFDAAAALSPYFLDRLFSLQRLNAVTDIRGYGMMAGIDIDAAIHGLDGYRLQKRLYDHGLHVKATGNTLSVCPPFICTHADIDAIVGILEETLTV